MRGEPMTALRNLRSVLFHRLPQAQRVLSAQHVYPSTQLRAFSVAPHKLDPGKPLELVKSRWHLLYAGGAAFVTAIVYEGFHSTRCEQLASSGQTKVALC